VLFPWALAPSLASGELTRALRGGKRVSIFLFHEFPHGHDCECRQCRSQSLPVEGEAASDPGPVTAEDMADDPQARLLRHLDSVGGMLEPRRPPAKERLREALGDTMTDLLLSAFASDRTKQPKETSQQETD
jgi:hypothetical protein